MIELTIPDGWRRYEPSEVRADGDRFCNPQIDENYSRIENWLTVSERQENPLCADFIYIKPVAKSFDEKFVESLREITAKVDAMIRDIKERVQ
jgi:hypothetical protein